MNWINANSSNVKRFSYDENGNVLIVEFSNSSTFRYLKVPKPVFLKMTSAPSVGKFLSAEIKGRYPHEKIEKIP